MVAPVGNVPCDSRRAPDVAHDCLTLSFGSRARRAGIVPSGGGKMIHNVLEQRETAYRPLRDFLAAHTVAETSEPR